MKKKPLMSMWKLKLQFMVCLIVSKYSDRPVLISSVQNTRDFKNGSLKFFFYMCIWLQSHVFGPLLTNGKTSNQKYTFNSLGWQGDDHVSLADLLTININDSYIVKWKRMEMKYFKSFL